MSVCEGGSESHWPFIFVLVSPTHDRHSQTSYILSTYVVLLRPNLRRNGSRHLYMIDPLYTNPHAHVIAKAPPLSARFQNTCPLICTSLLLNASEAAHKAFVWVFIHRWVKVSVNSGCTSQKSFSVTSLSLCYSTPSVVAVVYMLFCLRCF